MGHTYFSKKLCLNDRYFIEILKSKVRFITRNIFFLTFKQLQNMNI